MRQGGAAIASDFIDQALFNRLGEYLLLSVTLNFVVSDSADGILVRGYLRLIIAWMITVNKGINIRTI
jgi:hypothetical protein